MSNINIFLAIGNTELDAAFEDMEAINIVDNVSDLEMLYNLLEFVTTDYLIINKLIAKDEEILEKIASRAASKKIKIIMLIDSFKSFENKRFVSKLVIQKVYSFHEIDKFSPEGILKDIKEYPPDFDFSILSDGETKIQKETVVKKINHTVREEKKVEVLNGITVCLISNGATGKSTLAWILAHSFADRGYKTAFVNIDEFYSANVLMGTLERSEEGLWGIEIRENLKLYTCKYGDASINNNQFADLLGEIRIKSEVTIIDCCSGYSENMMTAITNSDRVLFAFDMYNLNTRKNMSFYKDIKNRINPQKVICIINKAIKEIEEYDNTINFIKELDDFRNILSIKYEAKALYNSIFTEKSPVKSSADKEFIKDIDVLMNALSARPKKMGILNKIGSFIRK